MQKSGSGSAALGIARGMVGCEDGTTSTAKALLHTNFCLMSDKTIAYWDKKLDIDKGIPYQLPVLYNSCQGYILAASAIY